MFLNKSCALQSITFSRTLVMYRLFCFLVSHRCLWLSSFLFVYFYASQIAQFMFSLKVLVDYVVVQQVLNNSWLKQGSESPISSYVSRMILQRTSPLVYLGPWLNELSNFILIPICFFIVLTLFSFLNHAHLLNALQLLSQVCSLEETLYSGTCMVGLFRD